MERRATPLERNQLYEIAIYKIQPILQLTWLQVPTPNQYQEATKRYLEYMERHRIKKLLSDSRLRGNPLPEELLWITHQVVPQLCEENIKQLAVVVPNDPNHARELECCLMTGEICYDLQFFHSPNDALDWLLAAPGENQKAVA
ncbi:MAG: hypothetical protein ACO1OQ_01305 [Rufibacter sp.]